MLITSASKLSPLGRVMVAVGASTPLVVLNSSFETLLLFSLPTIYAAIPNSRMKSATFKLEDGSMARFLEEK